MRTELPPELEAVRNAARRALGPVTPATDNTKADKDFLFKAKRTDAGRKLPEQHLVRFVLVDLLGFKDLGKFEKVAWSVPVDLNGCAFLIEHRKFGVGVFAHDPATEEADAEKIVNHIHKAVKAARPFFDWLAGKAVEESSVNVNNNSTALFDRFEYFLESHRNKAKEADDRKGERVVKKGGTEEHGWQSITYPATRLRAEARWLGLAAIEAFFSWTEHVLIHIGILSGGVRTAGDVAILAEADWAAKYKSALDLADPASKDFYDRLLVVRKELRNFLAHGSFGKQGEAFSFHSSAGAVPVLLPDPIGSRKFSFGQHLSFDVAGPIRTIEEFIGHLWSGPRAPAEIYIQRYQLPLILTMVADGSYTKAMTSPEEMEQFANYLAGRFDRAADMDW
ncbi:hypothetical protein [Mesorhizobium abyssinicae]